MKPGEAGLAFRAFTVNVENKADEVALKFLKSEPFTKGLDLAGMAISGLAPLTRLATGLVELVLARNRNIAVQDIFLGLDFADTPAGARLRTGSYIAAQVSPEDVEGWSWSHWKFDRARGLVGATEGAKAQFNYFIFSVAR